MKDHIGLYLQHNRGFPMEKRLVESDYLTPENWRIIAETVTFLKLFYDQTKRLQSRAKEGSQGALWEAYTLMELLINHVKQAKKDYNSTVTPSDPAFDDYIVAATRKNIRTFLNNCWGKFNEYYRKYDQSLAYIAVIVLHPGLKWRYFEIS